MLRACMKYKYTSVNTSEYAAVLRAGIIDARITSRFLYDI